MRKVFILTACVSSDTLEVCSIYYALAYLNIDCAVMKYAMLCSPVHIINFAVKSLAYLENRGG